MYDLGGQAAIVTGAANGIGRAIALRLAQEGCRVGLFDIDGAGAHATAELVRAAGGTAAVAIGNVARREEVDRSAAELEREFGTIDILVNNAGILRTAPFLELTDAAWHDTFGVNLDGAFYFSQAALPAMVAQGAGAIVNIASFAGKKGLANHAAYSASKFALIGLTQCMAAELAEHGVRVNAVCPGIIVDTGMRDVAEASAKAEGRPGVEVRAQAVPMRRTGRPDEIARVVAFLASGEAGYMTGQAINVTGGLWMS
jgi:NAD(P)-dependent dehydrogenase (short-subunit alcohol dehydrogenase family)